MSRRSQVSAGLLAFRRNDGIEVLLAHPGGPFWSKKDDGAWTIPKGVSDADADTLSAARREFTEETGFVAEGDMLPLKAVRQRSGKTVMAWAFEADFDLAKFRSNEFEMEWPPRSGRTARFPEVDRGQWFPIAEAFRRILTSQAPILEELQARVGG
jgi:predicted NUDIX family NTP pyrophosphohydrolase